MNAFWGNVLFLASPLLKEGFPGGSVGKASAFYVGDPGSIPRSGSSLAEGIFVQVALLSHRWGVGRTRRTESWFKCCRLSLFFISIGFGRHS